MPDQAELRDALLNLQSRAAYAVNKQLREQKARLRDLASRRVMVSPGSYVDQKRVELDYAQNRLMAAFERAVSARRHEYVRLAAALDAMSPLKVFSRGFSLASNGQGEILRSVSGVRPGEELQVRLADGTVKSTVTEIIGKE